MQSMRATVRAENVLPISKCAKCLHDICILFVISAWTKKELYEGIKSRILHHLKWSELSTCPGHIIVFDQYNSAGFVWTMLSLAANDQSVWLVLKGFSISTVREEGRWVKQHLLIRVDLTKKTVSTKVSRMKHIDDKCPVMPLAALPTHYLWYLLGGIIFWNILDRRAHIFKKNNIGQHVLGRNGIWCAIWYKARRVKSIFSTANKPQNDPFSFKLNNIAFR